jgi:hypothetical protein
MILSSAIAVNFSCIHVVLLYCIPEFRAPSFCGLILHLLLHRCGIFDDLKLL